VRVTNKGIFPHSQVLWKEAVGANIQMEGQIQIHFHFKSRFDFSLSLKMKPPLILNSEAK
jgi:hypothetical protein